ncbi:MAG TPA: DUF1707 domain-containing protein [Streptosporangiaceae bacterium]|nr:DUF1707 domain-containing protein [Streptosporangiaceae bacterium]
MTSQLVPGDGTPELRASHEDRDRVVEMLRVAAGDGRLTAEELDERLEAALTARTQSQLAVLTADLPAAPGPAVPSAPDVLRMVHMGGNARQLGQWIVPKRIEVRCTGGNVRLDFTQAQITGPVLQIDALVRGGNFVIITRPGVVVDISGVEVIGGSANVRPPRGPQPPVILRVEIAGQVWGGNLRARPRRRSFWEWLARRERGDARPAINR